MNICLSMIVKNEAHIIERCLDSVRDYIDCVDISDTGSNDGTPLIIKAWLKKNSVDGEVSSHKWRDFSTNRNLALDHSRKSGCDYILTLDADELLKADISDETFRNQINSDLHYLTVRSGEITYGRPLIFKSSIPFEYRGAVHESIYCDTAYTKGKTIEGVTVEAIADGSRSKSGDKFVKDISLLEEAVKSKDALHPRHLFYLAQSYRDAGMKQKAYDTYLKRACLNEGYFDEQYVSFLNCAWIAMNLKMEDSEIIHLLLSAIQVNPSRAEAFHSITRFYNQRQQFNLARIFAEKGILCHSHECLFRYDWIYGYGIRDEYAIASFYTGDVKEARKTWSWLKHLGKFPESHLPRIENNLKFCEAA